MKLDRLPHDPGTLADFYQEALPALGALCERTWHDRVCVVAEGPAARLWNPDGALHEVELSFVRGDELTARDPAREVFPGCPLTFKLAEMLLPSPPTIDRVAVRPFTSALQPPREDTAARTWMTQAPTHSGWRLERPFQPGWHFSLVSLVRCDVQAIDQSWSCHRIVFNLSTGESDDSLGRELGSSEVMSNATPPWPAFAIQPALARATRLLEAELAAELAGIRARQETHLRREWDRIEEYFDMYQADLEKRLNRSSSAASRARLADRLGATAAERERQRQDQVLRHEILVIPHWDAFLLVAEPAWTTQFSVIDQHERRAIEALFVPRLRCWLTPPKPPESCPASAPNNAP